VNSISETRTKGAALGECQAGGKRGKRRRRIGEIREGLSFLFQDPRKELDHVSINRPICRTKPMPIRQSQRRKAGAIQREKEVEGGGREKSPRWIVARKTPSFGKKTKRALKRGWTGAEKDSLSQKGAATKSSPNEGNRCYV